jgi:hypothetical protein
MTATLRTLALMMMLPAFLVASEEPPVALSVAVETL